MTEQEFIDYMRQHPVDLSGCTIDDDGMIDLEIPKSYIPQEVLDFANQNPDVWYIWQIVICHTGEPHNCHNLHHPQLWMYNNNLHNIPRHYYGDNQENPLEERTRVLVNAEGLAINIPWPNPTQGTSWRLNVGCYSRHLELQHDVVMYTISPTADVNLYFGEDYYGFDTNNGQEPRIFDFYQWRERKLKSFYRYRKEATKTQYYRFSMAVCANLVRKERLPNTTTTNILYQHVGHICSWETKLPDDINTPGTWTRL